MKMRRGGQTLLLLGDSITVGWTGTYCGYRGYLKDNLNKYNFNCCFLGTKDDNSDMLEDKYKHYYAIVGYRIENLLSDIEKGLILDKECNNPDIIFLLIGTNNITIDREHNKLEYDKLLDSLDVQFPSSRKLISTIIPLPVREENLVEELNDDIRELVSKRKNYELVDLYSEYPVPWNSYFVDGVHPNDAGYEYIANKIFKTIIKQ